MTSNSTTRIKAKNFLANISYNGVKKQDLFDKNFAFDGYTLTTKSINPFSLERKTYDLKNKEMIQIICEECNKPSFYKHICQPDNLMHLNSKDVIHPHVAEVVWKYIEKDEKNFDKMKKKLQENKKIFQFVLYTSILQFILRSIPL